MVYTAQFLYVNDHGSTASTPVRVHFCACKVFRRAGGIDVPSFRCLKQIQRPRTSSGLGSRTETLFASHSALEKLERLNISFVRLNALVEYT